MQQTDSSVKCTSVPEKKQLTCLNVLNDNKACIFNVSEFTRKRLNTCRKPPQNKPIHNHQQIEFLL